MALIEERGYAAKYSSSHASAPLRVGSPCHAGLLSYMNRAAAASAENEYVTVSCGTAGVESIVSINEDFYITTLKVGKSDHHCQIPA